MIPILPNPHDNLTREELSSFSKFYIKNNIISDDECKELVDYGLKNSSSAIEKHNYGVIMDLHHCFLPKNHWIHNSLEKTWKDAIDYFKFDVEFIEPYKIQGYKEGGYFNRHIDNYHGISHPLDRKLSMSLQLTEESEYEGGDLVIGNTYMSRRKNTVILFPSFYPHHVTKVIQGKRWVLITWAWGPYWK